MGSEMCIRDSPMQMPLVFVLTAELGGYYPELDKPMGLSELGHFYLELDASRSFMEPYSSPVRSVLLQSRLGHFLR